MTPRARDPRLLLPAVGAVVVLATTMVAAGSLLAIPFAAWALTPYLALYVFGRRAVNVWPVIGAGVAAIATELGVRAAVFIWPRGSTAAIALVFSPAYILATMPAGAALGWLFGVAWRRHTIGRVLVLVASPVIVGLILIGFARPELFPTAVARRRALLTRVGPPRIAVGGDAFERTVVSDQPVWSLTGELDGAPGDELALVEHRGARILDPVTLQTRQALTFPEQRGGFWTSFATLVRFPDGQIAIAETGGGFSRTFVRRLDGSMLWEHRPDATLTPDSLDPADLDGDGAIEFYGASSRAIARLDPAGREVWQQPTKPADLAALLPRSNTQPAWIVGVEYGVRALVFGDSGTLLGTLPVPEGVIATAADFGAERLVVLGDTHVRGYTLGGTLRVDIPLGDFTASQIVGARLAAGAPSALVIVGATDRDTRRWRLFIVDGDQRVVYDEITDAYPRVIVARGVDRDTVFTATGATLRRLSPLARIAKP